MNDRTDHASTRMLTLRHRGRLSFPPSISLVRLSISYPAVMPFVAVAVSTFPP
jgi:hypothetical protein